MGTMQWAENLFEICHLMNDTFHEEVSPVVHRTHAGINVFIGLNVMRFVDEKKTSMEYKAWIDTTRQTLLEQVQFDADIEIREGD